MTETTTCRQCNGPLPSSKRPRVFCRAMCKQAWQKEDLRKKQYEKYHAAKKAI